MFTGIIEGLGKITAISSSTLGGKLSIISSFDLKNCSIGDSIAINGTCLTITKIRGRSFDADISPETLRQTILKNATIGELINLERALKLSDRIDGHLVSGHVDDIIKVINKKNIGNVLVMTFDIPKYLSKYIITKGSIAIDGISLTVNTCNETFFSVSVIPHTMGLTTLNIKKIGDWVNIEVDLIGKYIEKLMKKNIFKLNGQKNKKDDINMAFLSKNGFV